MEGRLEKPIHVDINVIYVESKFFWKEEKYFQFMKEDCKPFYVLYGTKLIFYCVFMYLCHGCQFTE